MVAMPTFDLVAGAVWLSVLAVWFIGVAVASWLRYREAARWARHAARLAEATSGQITGSGRVISFPRHIEQPGEAAEPQQPSQPALPSGV
jgi:hypothetical protein